MTNGDVFALGVAALAVVLGLWVAWSTIVQARTADARMPPHRPGSPAPSARAPLPPPVASRVSAAPSPVTTPPMSNPIASRVPATGSETGAPAPRTWADAPVTVELLTGPDGQWCRITSTDTVPLEVDIFSHRPAGSPATAPWRHLLLDGALTVPPGVPAIIALGSDVTAAIDVVIGGTAPSRPGRSWRGRLVAR